MDMFCAEEAVELAKIVCEIREKKVQKLRAKRAREKRKARTSVAGYKKRNGEGAEVARKRASETSEGETSSNTEASASSTDRIEVAAEVSTASKE